MDEIENCPIEPADVAGSTSDGGRQTRLQVDPARRRCHGKRRRYAADPCLDQTPERTGSRFDRAVKRGFAMAFDQQRRKILDVDIADQVGFIFDVNPQEQVLRMRACQAIERRLERGADIAPVRAQAGDDPDALREPIVDELAVGMAEDNDGHAAILPAPMRKLLGRRAWSR